MTSFWSKDGDERWTAHTVAGDGSACITRAEWPFKLLPFGRAADRKLAMLIPPGTQHWVNGEEIVGGLRILEHRDEVLADGATFYYSAESTPVAAPFQRPAGVRRLRCPTCRCEIEEGMRTVTCPRCGRVYHQIDSTGDDQPAKHCWTYQPRCLCEHPTSLSDDDHWRPDREADCA